MFFDFIISPNSSSILFPFYICSDLVTGQPFFSKSLNSFYIYIFLVYFTYVFGVWLFFMSWLIVKLACYCLHGFLLDTYFQFIIIIG